MMWRVYREEWRNSMKKDNKRNLFRIWDAVLSLLLVTAGICLMVRCYGIYRGGGYRVGAYTPETVAAAFRPIRWVVYAAAGMAVFRLIAHFFEDETPSNHTRQVHMVYKRAASRADLENCPEKEQILALREQRRQRLNTAWGTFSGCSAVFLTYALNASHFTTDVTGSVILACQGLLIAMVLPFAYAVYAVYKNRASMEQELELLKKAPKKEAAPVVKKNYIPALRLVLVGFAIGLIVVGLNLGGVQDVLTKAINICTECVGLG